MILKHGGALRVEVKTKNKAYAPKYHLKSHPNQLGNYDVLAIVDDEKITYFPDMDALDGW